MKMIKIKRGKVAIDLSTKKIGVCHIQTNGEVTLQQIELKPFSQENMKYNIEILQSIIQQYTFEQRDTLFGIELANFKNAKLTTRFNLYAGVLYGVIIALGFENVKLFNSNAWQFKVGCVNTDEREIRKEKAKEWAIEHGCKNNLSEDEYDAFCIAWFLEEINSTEDTREEVIKNKKRKKNDK